MQIIRISAQTHITRACGATSKRYLRLGDFNDFKFGNYVFLVGFSKKLSVISRRKQRSAFDQVSEFDRGRIVAYRDCGLFFREIGSRVGRNHATEMRICDSWMQEGTTDRRDRSHPPQCTTSREDGKIVRMAVKDRSVTSRTVAQRIESVTHHSVSARTIRRRLQLSGLSARRPLLGLPLTQNHGRFRRHCLEAPWREDAEQLHRHTGPAPDIVVLGGVGYHSRTPLVHIAGTLNNQCFIYEVLEPVVLPYVQGLATAIFQQDNAQPHVTRIVQRLFVNHQIELLPWPARSPDLSPIGNMWSMVAQRLTQITPPAAPPVQLWQRGEAA
ncbi:transposable element Tcb1 transposase [Trichonephila clavipes]|nr:transposable element Tcb1 transposase [Trichonephila clavipes]